MAEQTDLMWKWGEEAYVVNHYLFIYDWTSERTYGHVEDEDRLDIGMKIVVIYFFNLEL